MKLKKYKKRTLGVYVSREIAIIILAFLGAFIIINNLYKRFNEIIVPLAEASARKHVTEIINNSTKDIKFENDLFIIEKSNNNEIKMITYNSYEATKLINIITDNIQDSFHGIEDKHVVFEVPVGIMFKNGMLRNLGPRIKARIDIMGDVISELETEVKPYGINNALVEVRVKLLANIVVILPFGSNEIEVKNIIPISINIVNGKIPEGFIASYK